MGLTKTEAQKVLGVAADATAESIRSRYKKLAKENHPDKHGGSTEATKKFQDISVAYNKLTAEDNSEDEMEDFSDRMSFEDMMDLFATVMLSGNRYGFFDEESSEDDEEYFYRRTGGYRPSYTSTKQSSSSTLVYTTSDYLTKEEIEKNARDLITEEEREKNRAAKRRDKKKRRREKKRQEKMQTKPDPKPASKSSSESSSESEDENIEPEYPFVDHSAKASKSGAAYQQSPAKSKPTSGKTAPVSHTLSDNGYSNRDVPVTNGLGQGRSEPDQYTPITRKPIITARTAKPSAPERTSKAAVLKQTVTATSHTPAASFCKPVVQTVGISSEAKAEARKFAVDGNKYAQNSDFVQAVFSFTKALENDPSDHRFYGNRSFCFDKLSDFNSALADAEQALSLKPDWAKGYFRRGRALAGIQSVRQQGEKNYTEAEQAFLQVLRLDKDCEDALIELGEVRVQQIVDMGFTEREARESILQHGTKELALDSLLRNTAPDQEVYESDEEDFEHVTFSQGAAAAQHQPKKAVVVEKKVPRIVCREPVKAAPKGADYERKLDPLNPDGLKAVWVGNLQRTTTEKELKQLFSKAGNVTGIRLMADKFCAFVNYNTTQEAGKAMGKFQGYPFGAQFLLIKFPDNPIKASMTKPMATPVEVPVAKVIKGGKAEVQEVAGVAAGLADKPRGPVNDGECYFWRTSGCQFGSSCKFKHIKASKGVDWRKK